MNILVVDDNPDERNLLAELLTQSGFNVVSAENGKQALEILNSQKDIAIIISDILMPVMDGFKFCYEVKSNPNFRTIPFIFYTGSYISEEDKNFGLKLGADDFIIKPVKFEILLNRINDIIKKGKIRKIQTEVKLDDVTYIAEYNARLVSKLEDKLIELNKAYEELKAINYILSQLNYSKNIQNLFKQISETILKLFDADAVNFFLYNEATNSLNLYHSFAKVGEKNIFENYPVLKIGDDFATEIIDQKLMIRHIASGSTKIRNKIFEEGFKIFVEVELRVRDKFIGSIELAYKVDEIPFNEKKLALLDTLSKQIAMVVDNFLLISELKNSEEKYKTFVHLTPAGLIVLDEKLNIIFASQIANKIFDCEIEGKNFKELINSPNLSETSLNYIDQTFEANYNDKVFLISMTRRLDDIKFGKHVAVINDITKLKRIQEEKKQIELKLWNEYKLASIGRLAGGIAHNLRNPLTILNLGLQVLKRKGIEPEQIDRLLKQVERINQIIENLSLKTKEEVEKQKKRFDLNELIKRELETLEFDPFYKHQVEKNIQLYAKPIVIEAVYSDFSNAISHILRNAVDAMLNSEKKILGVKTWEDEDKIYIEISDTGVGIPDEIKDKIFEPFFTTKTMGNPNEPIGIGLGLTITYNNLKIYGAEFEIDSKVGEGTNFKVIIPKRTVKANASQQKLNHKK
jgi:signal transduction histidine kinase/DNA-binding response OmpR family regulator